MPRYHNNHTRAYPKFGRQVHRARAYSPTLMRWMQQDPLGFIDGMNSSLMERGRPTSGLDPTGLADTADDSIEFPTITEAEEGKKNADYNFETDVILKHLGLLKGGKFLLGKTLVQHVNVKVTASDKNMVPLAQYTIQVEEFSIFEKSTLTMQDGTQAQAHTYDKINLGPFIKETLKGIDGNGCQPVYLSLEANFDAGIYASGTSLLLGMNGSTMQRPTTQDGTTQQVTRGLFQNLSSPGWEIPDFNVRMLGNYHGPNLTSLNQNAANQDGIYLGVTPNGNRFFDASKKIKWNGQYDSINKKIIRTSGSIVFATTLNKPIEVGGYGLEVPE